MTLPDIQVVRTPCGGFSLAELAHGGIENITLYASEYCLMQKLHALFMEHGYPASMQMKWAPHNQATDGTEAGADLGRNNPQAS